ncbi:hypothetical protein PC9H_006863 [Pleurotus ostreatus]|uniref:Uncharacterized protein n=1 Tax=Pleurotus ostreatus TaxID=5322 RepID=A0A8H6ZXR9_PLEOS|nr:uncharacterized protein PC9H_006863 [Pleurotus ostreatus]KAF7431143.1 hypothetical protein PC9H_006863 [Pleurotus ostreatus]KAJ8695566.1 hypothetical protein PTI98_008157 [Pleurotus ostreatus]
MLSRANMPPIPFNLCPMYPQRNLYGGNHNLNGNATMSHYSTGHPGVQYTASDMRHVYPNENENAEGQMPQFPLQPFDAGTWEYCHRPSSQDQFRIVPQSLLPEDQIYSAASSNEARAHDVGHRGVQQFHVSDVDNNPWVPGGQLNERESGAMDPERSATSQVIRRVATVAVIDAAERRRTNPHRFFCHHCDRGFTATHNYKQLITVNVRSLAIAARPSQLAQT